MAKTHKTCAKCHQALPVGEFPTYVRKNRGGRTYHFSYCRTCKRPSAEVNRDRSLKTRYGITSQQFEAMFVSQGSRCAACGSTVPRGKYWHIDHDHNCCSSRRTCGECIRAILCHGCNTALGNLGDDPLRVAALLAYAEAHVVR